MSCLIIEGKKVYFDKVFSFLISPYNWRIDTRGYASSYDISKITKRQSHVLLHRLITLSPDTHIDHINGNILDNRLYNLRPVTRCQNQWNAKRRKDNSSLFKGVSFHKQSGFWRARIQVNGTRKSLGLFLSPRAASRAYIKASKKLHGEFSIFRRGESGLH